MLSPQTIVRDRYCINHIIKKRTTNIIYQAKDQHLEATVAIKHCTKISSLSQAMLEYEAHLLMCLDHPMIPKVHDFFTTCAGLFLVMEYIPGPDLAKRLVYNQAPFAFNVVHDWATQLCDVLEYLHQRHPPLIHNDIKPENIKLSSRGHVVLLDFDHAKSGKASTKGYTRGQTLPYASLEQFYGKPTDYRSDMYALAATLYDLLTGVKPPSAPSRLTALKAGKDDPLYPIHVYNPLIPPTIDAILRKALTLHPYNRTTDIATIHHTFNQVYEQEKLQTSYRGRHL